MRKFLLASVATLGTGGLAGAALAQTPPGAPVPHHRCRHQHRYQGQSAHRTRGSRRGRRLRRRWPMSTPTTTIRHRCCRARWPIRRLALSSFTSTPRCRWRPPGRGPALIHGRSLRRTARPEQRRSPASAAGHWLPVSATSASAAQSAILGVNGTGTAKLQPQIFGSFARLYFGGDGMATNGLRYGAAIEIRENFSGQPSGASASTYASLETIYIRRAFTYVAGDNFGIVRAGQADGLIGIFDNGVTTAQFLPTGNFNGGSRRPTCQEMCRPHLFGCPRPAASTAIPRLSTCCRRSRSASGLPLAHRDNRPGLVTSRALSVESSTSWRHGRSAGWDDPDRLGELRSRDIDLYLHPAGARRPTPRSVWRWNSFLTWSC